MAQTAGNEIERATEAAEDTRVPLGIHVAATGTSTPDDVTEQAPPKSFGLLARSVGSGPHRPPAPAGRGVSGASPERRRFPGA
jgi:hypothetical protein